MPGGLQIKKVQKLAEKILGESPKKNDRTLIPFTYSPRSRNINPNNITADDRGVGDFVRGSMNGTF